MPAEEPRSEPRTLADDLRGRSDEELATLLKLRPDLLTPVPTDVTSLVARATTRASVTRALERLDRFTLQVVDAFACLPDPTTYSDILALITDRDHLATAVHRLRSLALVWGPESSLRVVRTVREVIGPAPAETGPALSVALGGFGADRLHALLADLGLPPRGDATDAVEEIARLFGDPVRMAALLDSAPAQAREVLDRLAAGPPVGRVERADRAIRAAVAATPVEWLLARGLLVAADPTTVVLPREVALHVRGGKLHTVVAPEPPEVTVVRREPELCERTAAGAAFTVTRQVEDLLESWGVDPPSVLRAGGLGVRELRRTATALDVPEPVAALCVETAYAAGLLAPSGEADPEWLPTLEYDAWRSEATAKRWAALAWAWLDTTRVPALAGERDDRDKLLSALGPDLDRMVAPEVRRDVLEALAELPPGAAADPESLTERLRWFRPRRGSPLWNRLIDWTLREAEVLGVTGRGALSAAGRALLARDLDGAAAALTPLLPEPGDHVLLQADLTAIAPGPLVSGLGRALALMADVESTGGATVYRFGEGSVRRALDAGRTAADLHALLATHSRTPVPQPLTYLIDDVARRHGRIRVGTASSYLRCDDEALLAQVLADRRASGLMLRRLAPTVLASPVPVSVMLDRLRDLGYTPAAESLDGDVLISRPDSRRTAHRPRPVRLAPEPTAPDPVLLGAAVKAIRAGDRAATAGRRLTGPRPVDGFGASGLPRSTPAESLLVLQQAVSGETPLWIGYVNAEGRASQRVIEPIKVEGGYVTAYDHARDEVRTFAIHRITGVAVLDDAAREAVSGAVEDAAAP
jgi:hypothetical protein